MTVFIRDGHIWLESEGGKRDKLTPELSLNDEIACEVCSFLGSLHPIFGNSETELDEIYKPFLPDLDIFSKGIVLFPGSFSPWHEGHEACISGQDKAPVVIIPDYNPWKEVRQNSVWNELRTLWKYCLGKSEVSIYSGFLALKQRNPTVSWLPELPISNKWLLMGDDSFLSFDQWKDFKLLLSSIRGVLICPRLGNQDELKEQAVKLQKNSTVEVEFLAPHAFQSISSSQIRNQK